MRRDSGVSIEEKKKLEEQKMVRKLKRRYGQKE